MQWSTLRAPELAGELHTGTVAELVAVHAQGEARGASGLEDRARLVAVEGVRGVRLAEDVDALGERWSACGDDGIEHRADDELDVCRPVGCVLAWHDVGAEERRVRGELARDAE